MIHNKENKIQILLENFKDVERSNDCNNVADYAKIESVSDGNFFIGFLRMIIRAILLQSKRKSLKSF